MRSRGLEALSRPDLLSRFAETFTKRLDHAVRGTEVELRDLDRQLERAVARVTNCGKA